MKIRNNTDIQHAGIVNKSIDFGIDKENIGILFRGFSDTLYSNKIGSIVREVTSNCFDSHREANINDDVTIAMVEADPLTRKNGKISFKDVGVGLSPTRIQDIYSKYFSSTKRETNNEIGGFGIGAKSPLAYTDVFEVNTIYEGIKYFYVVHRGDKVPHIKLINQEKTDEHNGTEVILPVRAGDENKFRSECKHQLRFFSNIHYINMDINNDYQIIQGKHWIASSHDERHSSDYKLSICLGGVSYPIDFNQSLTCRNVSESYLNEWSSTTIALKFDIGEIDVTMSRESIEYNDRTIKAIQDKYTIAAQELISLYANSWADVTDFREYFINANKRRHQTMLPVNEAFINISFCIKDAETPIFKPWDLAVTTNDLNSILKTYQILDGKRDMKKYDNYPAELMKTYSIDKWFRKNGKLNRLTSNYIHDEIIQQGSFVCSEIAPEPNWDHMYSGEGAKEQYTKLKPLVLKYLIDNTKSYDKIKVPEKYIESQKTVVKQTKQKVPRTQVCVRYPRWKGEYDRYDKEDVVFSKDSTTYNHLSELLNQGRTIVYDVMENEENLRKLAFVLTGTPLALRNHYDIINKDRVSIHKIAQSHVKYYKLIGALSIKEFLIKHYNTLIGIEWANKLETVYKCTHRLYDDMYKIFPSNLKEFLNTLEGRYKNRNSTFETPYYSMVNDSRSTPDHSDGVQVTYLKELLETYNIPYNSDNHMFFIKDRKYHSKSLYKLLSEIGTELQWIEHYFCMDDNNKREYHNNTKALQIIGDIPKIYYSKLMYKIKNYFNEK